MISLLVSIAVTSCKSVEYVSPVIPEYDVPLPTPDKLVEIPKENPQFSYTKNMAILDTYSQKLEIYIQNMKNYYAGISKIRFETL
jgi:hypothetical protein